MRVKSMRVLTQLEHEREGVHHHEEVAGRALHALTDVLRVAAGQLPEGLRVLSGGGGTADLE